MEFSFTDRELDIMGVVWDQGSATVAEVRDAIADRRLSEEEIRRMCKLLDEHLREREP
jgi:predicted transcriptional regulator